jgi:hypothetical protein
VQTVVDLGVFAPKLQRLVDVAGKVARVARIGHRERPDHTADRYAAGNELLWPEVEKIAERVACPPGHGVSGDDVLADRELVERADRARRDNWHLSRRHVGRVGSSFDRATRESEAERHRTLLDQRSVI